MNKLSRNILIIFLLGCFSNYVEDYKLDFPYLIGGGIGILLISFTLGATIYFIASSINRPKQVRHSDVLDNILEEQIKEDDTLTKASQMSLYVSFFVFILTLIGQ